MKNIIFLVILIVVAMTTTQAQEIIVEKGVFGYKFYQDGDPINLRYIKNQVELNSEEYFLLRKANNLKFLSGVFGFFGGYMVSYHGVNLIRLDQRQNALRKKLWNRIGIGVTSIAIGIPIQIASDKRALEGITIYNSKIPVE